MEERRNPEAWSGRGSASRSLEGAWLALLLASTAAGQVTSRVSVDSAGAQGNYESGAYGPSISADGRFVAFVSAATNLVAGDKNWARDVFVHDRQSGTTERVSVDSDGREGNGTSGYYGLSMSADGRYVAFASGASNLVTGDSNGVDDVFVRDRVLGITKFASVDSAGTQGNGDSNARPSISADGRYVAFGSSAANLVVGDTNGAHDVFVRDRLSGTTERVSVDSAGAQANGSSGRSGLWISAGGRFVAFQSDAANLVSGDTNGARDVFVHDRLSGTTERVSVDSVGTQANGSSGYFELSISADGRYVVFESDATNLVTGDTNVFRDVFVHDRESGKTERVSVDSAGTQGNQDCARASVSADGRYVAFESMAANLVIGDTNRAQDMFVHDRQTGTTERVSVDSAGTQADAHSGYPASISDDGRYVAFMSDATNLVVGDTNGYWDVFVRDRNYWPFTSLCDPGAGGVLACPCSNPPSGPDRGCDNSSATGGAILSASGIAYLSQDTLVFTTSGERPTALSIVFQGNAFAASGIAYGQGVRCAGGTLKPLYRQSASNGSITVPDFGAGDPTVSARSAAKGDPIAAGSSRWYLVAYRDPNVLGGCPASSAFNATQTGRVTWWP